MERFGEPPGVNLRVELGTCPLQRGPGCSLSKRRVRDHALQGSLEFRAVSGLDQQPRLTIEDGLDAETESKLLQAALELNA